MDRTGRPRMMDFGLALMVQPWDEPSRPEEEIPGTLAYMAPEQAEGQTDRIGTRTDIFGLGAVLYETLTGRPPYQAAATSELWEQTRRAKILPPRQVNRRIPRTLEQICLRALAANPEDRYASAARMAQALGGYLRRPLQIALALGLLLLAVGSVLALAIGPFEKPSPPVEVRSFGVFAFRDKLGPLGEVGVTARDIWQNDSIQILAQFSKPAYCYLVAFNPDGREQLCLPSKPDDDPAPDLIPPRTKELCYPTSPERGFSLDDGPGMQAFVLLASAQPLPAYARWQREVGVAPWQKAQGNGIWRFDGKDFEPGNKRGKVREMNTLPKPLVELYRFFQNSTRIEAFRVISFPVKP
jgi:serine/threonine protein kinase